jgi:HK97 family phage prohead protease
VVLFAHDNSSTDTVIGRMDRIWTDGDRLMGQARFMEASLNPLAETVYQMVRQGFLSAVSVGFIPLDGKPAKGRGHGAFDFTRQELLEVSVVPVGAHPAALVMGRAAGIDAQPMLDWARRFVAASADQSANEPAPDEIEIDIEAKIRELLPSALADLMQRHGRVLSADNEGHLKNAQDCLTQATGHVQTVLDQVASEADADPDQDEDGIGDADARDFRARRARALKLTATT